MTDRTWRIGVWCAVSSKPQAGEDKISLEAQEAAGRAFAEAVAGVVVAVYRVPGHSRDIIFWNEAEREMPAYRRLREDVAAGQLDVLHATDPDRLGRDPALSNQVVSLVEKAGGEVYLASNPHILGQKGSGQRYVFAIQSTRAGEEQSRRVAYHRTGMENRVERGLHPGRWPLGYTPIREGRRVVGADLDENAEAVRMVTRLFLRGLPYRAIAEQMNGTGWPSSTWGGAPGKWLHSTVRRLVHCDVYAGIVEWSDTRERSDRFPHLWDEATFQAVLRERTRRRHANGRRATAPFAHVAICGRCGGPMYRAGKGYGGDELLCCGTHKRDREQCHANTTHEADVTATLLAYFQDPDVLTDDQIRRWAAQGGDRAQAIHRLEEIERQVKQIEEQRTRLALAFAAGAMEVDVYQRSDAALRGRLDALAGEKTRAEGLLWALPDPVQREAALIGLRERVGGLFDLPALEVNALLRDAGVRVVCEDGEVQAVRLV